MALYDLLFIFNMLMYLFHFAFVVNIFFNLFEQIKISLTIIYLWFLTLLNTININAFIINISYKIIYIYSLCQIKYNMIKKYIQTHIINNYNNMTCDNNSYYDVKICTLTFTKNAQSYCYKFVQNHSYPHIMDVYENYHDIKPSKVAFISMELSIPNTNIIYPISLKTDNRNYLMIGNRFTNKFFSYYIKHELNQNIPQMFDTYVINIIDHNVNMITINYNQTLILEESTYKILD